jgi:hypothetical protein
LYANSLSFRIDVHRAHSGKVDDETVVAECAAAHIVAATANRRQQIVVASEVDSRNNVSDT